jgi:hypothetical protein
MIDLPEGEMRDVLPDAAWDNTVEGAEATALFFAAEYARMYHTGDSTRWRVLSASMCEGCAGPIEGAAELHARGWGARGGDIVPRETRFGPHSQVFEPGDRAYVSYAATAEDAYTIDEDGVEELTGPSREVQVNVELLQIDEVWRVTSFSVTAL